MAKVSSGSVSTSSYQGRYYKVSWSASQNVSTNKSTISWKIEALGGTSSWYAERTLKVVIAGTTVYSKTARVERYKGTIASGTVTISHNASGDASFSISIQAAVYDTPINCTGSASFDLTNIPRKSTLSVGNGTLGTAQTLTVTRKSTSFTHSIYATCGSLSTDICTKSSSTSISFAPPANWASQNTTGTSLTVKYVITTYNGNTIVGLNEYTKTCTIPNTAAFKPSVTFTVAEATSGLNVGAYIQNRSKLKIVVTAKQAYGAAIASYRTTVDGKTYTSSSFTTSVIQGAGSVTISVTIKDKRGRTATIASKINVVKYIDPVFTMLKVNRCDSSGVENIQGDYCKATFACDCSPVYVGSSYLNTVTLKVYYKKTTEPESAYILAETINHGTIGSTGTTGTLTSKFQATSDSSYHVKVVATDKFGDGSQVAVLSTGFAIIHWLATGFGLAFGKLAEITGVLDIGFKTRFFGGILQPVLEAGTDFDTLLTPNTYTLKNASAAGYINCPFASGTGVLTIETVGEEGQTRQIVTVCHKTNPLRYERHYYQGTWGDWICTSDFDGVLLWDASVSAAASNGWFMTSGHIANLAEPVSKQRTGIILVFSEYVDGSGVNQAFHTRFIPKALVSLQAGYGHTIQLSTSKLEYFATKYLYISDTRITGHDNNNLTGTSSCGITYTNNRFVLRYVIGV